MGLIQAAIGALGGTMADQWKDFLTVTNGLPQTTAGTCRRSSAWRPRVDAWGFSSSPPVTADFSPAG